MTTMPETEAEWLRSLSSKERARFLAWLSHSLTIAGRVLKHSTEPADLRLEQLYQLNEIQHRVTACLKQLLSGDGSVAFERSIAASLLDVSDDNLRNETSYAWENAKARALPHAT